MCTLRYINKILIVIDVFLCIFKYKIVISRDVYLKYECEYHCHSKYFYVIQTFFKVEWYDYDIIYNYVHYRRIFVVNTRLDTRLLVYLYCV